METTTKEEEKKCCDECWVYDHDILVGPNLDSVSSSGDYCKDEECECHSAMETTKVTACHVCGKEKGSEEEICVDNCDRVDMRDVMDEFQRD